MSPARILICDELDPAALGIFRERGFEPEVRVGLAEDALVGIVPGVQALVVRSATKITRRVIEAATDLRVIGRAGVGVDNVDTETATERGVVVMNTPDGNTTSAAELAIALLLALARHVPRADRIVGPGNIYVAAAKKLLAGEVGIDFIAGPTEILIIAADGDPMHLAADMLAQAEHDVDACAILLTTSKRLASSVAAQIDLQLETLPTAPVARKAITRNSAIVLTRSLDEAIEISNRFAPEHLSIGNDSLLSQVTHAGSVFVGQYSPEAAGDYASGPNHVLPTSGMARLRGGLSAADYVKVISVQQLNEHALSGLAPAITTLARAEGLEAHARSVEVRVAR
jgi:histidinol dehydrogenase